MVNRNFVPQKMKKNLKKTPHVSSTQVRQVLHEKGKEVANRKDFIGWIYIWQVWNNATRTQQHKQKNSSSMRARRHRMPCLISVKSIDMHSVRWTFNSTASTRRAQKQSWTFFVEFRARAAMWNKKNISYFKYIYYNLKW